MPLSSSPIFFAAHVETKGPLTAFFSVLLVGMIFGSAFLDRILYDPSAVFIEKPWRVMRPSIGDSFRLTVSVATAVLTLPIVIMRGTYIDEAALFEFGLIALFIGVYEALRLYVERVRWHGTAIDVRSKIGRHASLKWAELRDVRAARFSNYIVFEDESGRSARVSRRLRGFSEFMRDAERYSPPELQAQIRLVK